MGAIVWKKDVRHMTVNSLQQAIREAAPDASERHLLVRLKLLCLDAHSAGVLSREELFSLLTLTAVRNIFLD